LQVKQKDDGIFISQDKYVANILKMFGFTTVKTASTLIEPNKTLIKDAETEDQTIVANSTTEAEYVAAASCCGQVLWIQNQMLDYGFDLMNTKIYIDNEIIEERVHPAVITTVTFGAARQALNEDTELPQTSMHVPNVPDGAVYKEWDDSVERDTTTVASLDATQDSGNILKTQSMAMPNVPLPRGIGTCGSPRCQETMRGSIAQTRSERVPTLPHDSHLPRVNTLGSDEGTKKKVNTYTRRRRAVSTGSEGVSTSSRIFSTAEESVSTTGESMPISTADVVQEGVKDKAQKLYEEEQARFNAEQEAKFNAKQEELLASETTKDKANPSVIDVDWDGVQA
nr:putative ribonuclease H-like domain-containing protein [Tanacetum cinerariifolium]